MNRAIGEWLATSRQKLNDGTLTSADLDRLEGLATSQRQLVLYLYSKSTNMRSAVASWMLYDATQPQEPKVSHAVEMRNRALSMRLRTVKSYGVGNSEERARP